MNIFKGYFPSLFLPHDFFFSFDYNHHAKNLVTIGNYSIFLLYTHVVSTIIKKAITYVTNKTEKGVYYKELIE